MLTLKNCFFILSALLMSGCSAFNYHYHGEDYGYLVMGIFKTPESTNGEYGIQITHLDSKKEYGMREMFHAQHLPMNKINIHEADRTGNVHVRSFPPGRYQITAYEIKFSADGGNYYFVNNLEEKDQISYEIKPGEITYIDYFLCKEAKHPYEENVRIAQCSSTPGSNKYKEQIRKQISDIEKQKESSGYPSGKVNY